MTNKGPFCHNICSNHVKHGSELLFYHTSQLITSIFIHGCTPDELLNASITSLVKDKMGNYCDSVNYRGIALSSWITKIYDIIIIQRYNKYLDTSLLQFAFKSDNSTVMCNFSTKEIIKYYTDR